MKTMDIKIEDAVSVLITLLLLAVWYSTLIIFNYPLISVLILWIGMITLFKIRFLVSAVPIYPVLIYYVYSLSVGEGLPKELKLLPFFVVFTMLILNASVVYIYDKKIKDNYYY